MTPIPSSNLNAHKAFTDANSEQEHFKTVVNESTNRHVPQKGATSRWNLAWMDGLKRLCEKKKRAWNTQTSKEEKDWLIFAEQQKMVKRQLERARKDYTCRLVDESEKGKIKKASGRIRLLESPYPKTETKQ